MLQLTPINRILITKDAEYISVWLAIYINPIAPRKAKIVYNFGLSECNRVKVLVFLCIVFSNDLDLF